MATTAAPYRGKDPDRNNGRPNVPSAAVRFPAIRAGEKLPGHESPVDAETSKVSSASSRRILVVDDNEDAASTLATLLKMQGHDVRVVYTGAAALVWIITTAVIGVQIEAMSTG